MVLVARPLVREFEVRQKAEAGAHARAGGHAVLWDGRARAHLVLPLPKPDDDSDLAAWSLYDLRQERYRVIRTGILRGLVTAPVPRDCNELIRRRIRRDLGFAGAAVVVDLDCLSCGACCRDNEVTLSRRDLARFTAAGRSELGREPFTKRVGRTRVFRLFRSKRCKHLLADNRCAIYSIRPQACSCFPVASESCLYSRQAELGIGCPPASRG